MLSRNNKGAIVEVSDIRSTPINSPQIPILNSIIHKINELCAAAGDILQTQRSLGDALLGEEPSSEAKEARGEYGHGVLNDIRNKLNDLSVIMSIIMYQQQRLHDVVSITPNAEARIRSQGAATELRGNY